MCARAAGPLLLHVNLLLTLYAGAGLATAARLKWDPTTYVAVRELLPDEYRVATVALCGAAAALLALAHLATAALCCSRRAARRALLLTYAGCTAALVVAEVAWLAWSGSRVAAWLRSERAAEMLELIELRDRIEPVLALLARWHPLPDRIKLVMQEASEDAPRNLYAALGALAVLGVLQPAAAVLALLAAAAPPPPEPVPARSLSDLSTDNERAPLRTAYRGGKLVIL